MSSQKMHLIIGYLWLLVICIESRTTQNRSEILEVHHLATRASKKCMAELGCFEISADFFHPVFRPFNLLPADRESINTKFELYTRKTSKQSEYIKANKKDIDKSAFNGERDTKVLIHGFVETQLMSTWMKDMTKEFLLHGDYNVILVDYTGGNFLPYTQAVANARVVGAEAAHLINFLTENYSLDPKRVHMIGMSLGGQVVGYAGERIKNLGRITALDPAGPYFENMPPSVRTDPTDALFVDVIHTDARSVLQLGLGINQQCGHVDFYPNNGRDHPGCSTDGISKILNVGLIEGVARVFACYHIRAIDFMMDSINQHECRPLSFACRDWETFKDGRCTSCGKNGELCAMMGLHAIDYKPFVKGNDSVKFYTLTGPKEPFCVFMYSVQVKLQNNNGQSRKGSLKLIVRGSKNTETFDISRGNIDLHPGATYNSLVTTSKNLGTIQSINFKWDRSTWIIGSIFKHYIFVDNIKITPLNEPETKFGEGASRLFCVKEKPSLESGKSFDAYPSSLTTC